MTAIETTPETPSTGNRVLGWIGEWCLIVPMLIGSAVGWALAMMLINLLEAIGR